MIKQIQDYRDAALARGGDLVGVLLSFRCPETVSIPFTSLHQAMHSDLNIPREWVPNPRNQLSLYLDSITGLNRSSASKFSIDPAVCGFTEETHAGYTVQRIFKRKEHPIPVIHKVFHYEKRFTTTTDASGKEVKQVDDVEVDAGIEIALHRIEGSSDTDILGTSKFSIIVNEGNQFPARYLPFIEKLQADFDSAQNLIYGSRQIRALINEIFNDHLKTLKVNSWSFALPDHLDGIKSLESILNGMNTKLNFLIFPVIKADDAASQSSFESTAIGVTESFETEIDKILNEIELLLDSEHETRDKTWQDRLSDVAELQTRLASYKMYALINSDYAESQINECISKIEKGMAGDLTPIV